MFTLEIWIAFTIACLALAISPGPENGYVVIVGKECFQ